jgi:glycosyltransferase involved in cell wall biosynthesis
MPALSVLIPGRKECFFDKTIASVLAASRADTEVIAVIDGEHLGPPVKARDRLTIIRHDKPLGQRQSINEAAKLSDAQFILKTDAHSTFDEGFDVKLMARCERDWTVLPRMYNLHAYDCVCELCGYRHDNMVFANCPECGSTKVHNEDVWKIKRHKKTDWMFFRSPDIDDKPLRVQYWDAKTARAFPAEYRAHRQWAKRQGEIADVMTGQGACWFMHRARFWELGGLDADGHGSWGQMGVEMACKAWLSGGRQVVNRSTWFAHLFRCGDGPGFPYQMSGKAQQRTRDYSIKLWTSGKWDKQVRPLEWLVEKFWPVPTWEKPTTTPALRLDTTPKIDRAERVGPSPASWEVAPNKCMASPAAHETVPPEKTLPSHGRSNGGEDDITIVYYTDSQLDTAFAEAVRAHLAQSAGEIPIISVSQQELSFGFNICVGAIGRSLRSIITQILAGARAATTPYVALCEHDVLYPASHFRLRPAAGGVVFDQHRHRALAREGTFTLNHGGRSMCLVIADRAALIASCAGKLTALGDDKDWAKKFEPSKGEVELSLAPVGYEMLRGADPIIEIVNHGRNYGKTRPSGRAPQKRLPDGRAMAEIVRAYHVPVTKARAPAAPSPAADVTVSVIIPARNEAYLQRTIEDVLAHCHLPVEVLVGLDGPEQQAPEISDPRVRFIKNNKRAGMRPTLNRLARKATGTYLLKLDAHCQIAEGMDAALLAVWKRGDAVVGRRYDLDVKRWQRREHSKTDIRRLTHKSEDGVGLRSLKWPEYDEQHEKDEIVETMSLSGSCYFLEKAMWDHWGGLDTEHGHFGQEGCEIACKIWLSGGRLLENKTTWYAHWNRGKATYSMGANVKPRSIKRSHDLWLNNRWPGQKYSFGWLLDKFQPPGWPDPDEGPALRLINQGGPNKAFRTTVGDLWARRHLIAEPKKRFRIDILWLALEEFVASILAGKPDYEGRYEKYLISHLCRGPMVTAPSSAQRRHIKRGLQDMVALTRDIRDHGLKAPLEFYRDEKLGRMILWKGYRRLAILHALGDRKLACRSLIDRRAAETLSPATGLKRLQVPVERAVKELAEQQYVTLGGRATDKYWVHGYTGHYDRHLHEIRKRAKKVLEVGLLRGASLKLWRDYFPKAACFGFDNHPTRWQEFAGDLRDTTVFVGDERSAADLQPVQQAGPYDLIVDDASHEPADQAQLYEGLWPHVRPFGYYVIEDIYRSFGHNKGRALPVDLESSLLQSRDIRQIHWYPNIVFVQKA